MLAGHLRQVGISNELCLTGSSGSCTRSRYNDGRHIYTCQYDLLLGHSRFYTCIRPSSRLLINCGVISSRHRCLALPVWSSTKHSLQTDHSGGNAAPLGIVPVCLRPHHSLCSLPVIRSLLNMVHCNICPLSGYTLNCIVSNTTSYRVIANFLLPEPSEVGGEHLSRAASLLSSLLSSLLPGSFDTLSLRPS